MTDFKKGQTVTFATQTSGRPAAGYGSGYGFAAGDTAVVTTVRRETITVKTRATKYGETKNYSFNVERPTLLAPNGEAWDEKAAKAAAAAKPKPRKMFEPPQGTVDPRTAPEFQWLWEDLAKWATNSGYCRQYDDIVEKAGIPGRERPINVRTTINGIEVQASVKARSHSEAETILKAKLSEAKA